MKEQIKTRYYGLLVRMQTPAAVDKFFRKYSAVTMCCIMLLCFATVAFADGDTGDAEGVFEQGKQVFSKIYFAIVGISTAAAVAAEAIAAILYFFSSNGRTVEQAQDWMKRIALGWLVINGMGAIVATAKYLIAGMPDVNF